MGVVISAVVRPTRAWQGGRGVFLYTVYSSAFLLVLFLFVINAVVYWCGTVLVQYCIGAVLYWCSSILVQYSIGAVMNWCSNVLVLYCIGAVLYW